jgi:hypothetical protein
MPMTFVTPTVPINIFILRTGEPMVAVAAGQDF